MADARREVLVGDTIRMTAPPSTSSAPALTGFDAISEAHTNLGVVLVQMGRVDRAVADDASARASVADAKAALSTDEINLSKASIAAPADGVVLTRTVDPGNAVLLDP